jgi:hypothetical protein
MLQAVIPSLTGRPTAFKDGPWTEIPFREQ